MKEMKEMKMDNEVQRKIDEQDRKNSETYLLTANLLETTEEQTNRIDKLESELELLMKIAQKGDAFDLDDASVVTLLRSALKDVAELHIKYQTADPSYDYIPTNTMSKYLKELRKRVDRLNKWLTVCETRKIKNWHS